MLPLDSTVTREWEVMEDDSAMFIIRAHYICIMAYGIPRVISHLVGILGISI